jgi:transcription termination factor Rho
MSVLSREALEASPLADLHTIASELGLDGFRRLRKEDLIDAIIARQGGEEAAAPAEAEEAAAEPEARPARKRGTRGGRGRSRAKTDEATADEAPAEEEEAEEASAEEERPTRRRRGRDEEREDEIAEGTVEVLANGSAFVRLNPPEESEGDVYVSAAQVRRCELVTGDRITGPVRRPRRSERYPSLVRVDTINGSAADEVAAGTPYDQLGAAFPSEPITFAAKDPVLKQIADLAPIGRGSRVSVVGAPGSGRTTTLRALAIELAAQEGVEVHVVLAGARPEELPEWTAAELEPAAAATLTSPPDAQSQAVDRTIDTARRIAARGGHAAVVIDALDHLAPGAARRALAAARSVPDGGSLTVIAAGREPAGGETTVIALDAEGAMRERHPVLDPVASHTLRTEALVGARKATTIAKNRIKKLEA